MNSQRIAAALRILAVAFETPEGVIADELPPTQPAAEPVKRGRGRPVKGEDVAPSAPAQASSTTPATPAPAEADPFETPAPVAAPTATIDAVRTAMKALAAATDQATALGVLKDFGQAANLTELKPELYGTVVKFAKAKQEAAAVAKAPEADPFDAPAPAAAKALTLEDVKAEVVKTSKRTSQDLAAKVVMDLGGKAAKPDGGGFGPSWKALPPEKYAEVIAALQALPTTK